MGGLLDKLFYLFYLFVMCNRGWVRGMVFGEYKDEFWFILLGGGAGWDGLWRLLGRDMVFVYMHCGGGCLYLGTVWCWFGATLSGRVVQCWCPGAGVCALTLRCLHFGVLTPKF